MKSIYISQAYLLEVLEYKDGCVFWRHTKCNRGISGNRAGTIGKTYRQLAIDTIQYFEHRLIWIMLKGDIPQNYQIDHIDGNKLNNNINNLRIATNRQNQMNIGINKRNTSGYKGVSYSKSSRKWKSTIKVNSEAIHLGFFKTALLAHKAYKKAALKHHGDFAKW